MDVRKKLVELLDDTQRSGIGYFGSAIENKKIADYLIRHGVTVQEEGYWIDIPPYRAINGDYNKAQECPKCHAFFVSNGNEPYSNHPYCCECGARLSPQPQKGA